MPISFTSRERGLSIIELLVVIAIIGLLAALILRGNTLAKQAARDAERIETVNELALLFELYKVENGRLPDCGGALIIEKERGEAADFQIYSGSCNDLAEINTFFSEQVDGQLADPTGLGSERFQYIYDSQHNCGGGYPTPIPMIFARMEVQENSNRESVCPQSSGNNQGGYNTLNSGEAVYPYVVGLE